MAAVQLRTSSVMLAQSPVRHDGCGQKYVAVCTSLTQNTWPAHEAGDMQMQLALHDGCGQKYVAVSTSSTHTWPAST